MATDNMNCEQCVGVKRDLCDMRFDYETSLRSQIGEAGWSLVDSLKRVVEIAGVSKSYADTEASRLLDRTQAILEASGIYRDQQILGCTFDKQQIDQKITIRMGER